MAVSREAHAFNRMSDLLGRAKVIENALREDFGAERGKLEDPSGLLESERIARLREDARVLAERLRETIEVLKARTHLRPAWAEGEQG